MKRAILFLLCPLLLGAQSSRTKIVMLGTGTPIPDPDRMQSSGARWLLFATWHGAHLTQSNSVDHLRTVYGHSYVVTRDEVPNLR